MPSKPPRICGCGHRITSGAMCRCEVERAKERKARSDANRPTARDRGYDTKWDRERKTFLGLNPKCVRCGAPSTVVNHKVPHRGSKKLFWSRSNWEAVCTPCHSGPIQREEARQE